MLTQGGLVKAYFLKNVYTKFENRAVLYCFILRELKKS